MELHHQTCQECGSTELNNILVRETGEPDKVIVVCNKCNSFVARYILGPQGYYHHGKGFESFLRSLNRGGFFSSGRDMKDQFEKTSSEAVNQFELVMKQLDKKESNS